MYYVLTLVCTMLHLTQCTRLQGELSFFLLSQPFQVIIVGAVAVNDGTVGLEGDHTVTGGFQHFVVVGGKQNHTVKGFKTLV